MDLAGIPLLDTHEHLRPEAERLASGGDVLEAFFSQYASTDLMTAGLSRRDLDFVRDPAQPVLDRWRVLAPYWEHTRYTAYSQSLRLAALDLYGVADITAETIEALAERLRGAMTPGLYRRVFERANIRLAVVQDIDPGPQPSPADPASHLRMVIKGAPLAVIRSRPELDLVTTGMGRGPAHSLADWLEVCDSVFETSPQAVALKMAHAYLCSLETGRPTFHDAEQVFNRIIQQRELFAADESLSWDEARPLRDYLIHHVIRLAIRRELPIQVHTGLLENTYNDVRDSHPHGLIPILLEYREARFALFHGAYPWLREFVVLGKAFPNVWLDLSWLWIIAPGAGRALLHELIETIPANKVCAFGGDYVFIEGTYGHSVLARRNIGRVLQEKIEEGWFNEDQALAHARAILHDNAAALYRV
jgi:hypothetical protein